MWWYVMNCVSVWCGIALEICCLKYVINHEGMECDLWLNTRTSEVTSWVLKWCELCQSWVLLYLYCCYNYIIVIFISYMYASVCLYPLRNVMTYSSCVVYVWIDGREWSGGENCSLVWTKNMAYIELKKFGQSSPYKPVLWFS